MRNREGPGSQSGASGGSTGGSSGSAERSSESRRGTSTRRGAGLTLSPRRWLRSSPLMMTAPWDLMRRATEEMERMLEAVDFGGFETGTIGETAGLAEWMPQMEVARHPNEMTVRVDLPGMDPNDIEITTQDGTLIIAGERSQEEREEEEGFVRSERRYGRFCRGIPLPDGADESGISASFDNGVLEITVPVSGEQQQGRRIPISSGSSRSKSSSSQSQSGSR